MIIFRLSPHGFKDEQLVEVLKDDKVIGVVYVLGVDGIRVVSAHFKDPKVGDDFAGEVQRDQRQAWPPIPAFDVRFDPYPYTIQGGKIIKE